MSIQRFLKQIPSRLAKRLAAGGLGLTALTALGQPNVIVVMTDDQGYPELSVHGNPAVNTPHLDRLHGQSLRLADYHVAPMCTPTRGQLLTGLDAARNRAEPGFHDGGGARAQAGGRGGSNDTDPTSGQGRRRADQGMKGDRALGWYSRRSCGRA